MAKRDTLKFRKVDHIVIYIPLKSLNKKSQTERNQLIKNHTYFSHSLLPATLIYFILKPKSKDNQIP